MRDRAVIVRLVRQMLGHHGHIAQRRALAQQRLMIKLALAGNDLGKVRGQRAGNGDVLDVYGADFTAKRLKIRARQLTRAVYLIRAADHIHHIDMHAERRAIDLLDERAHIVLAGGIHPGHRLERVAALFKPRLVDHAPRQRDDALERCPRQIVPVRAVPLAAQRAGNVDAAARAHPLCLPHPRDAIAHVLRRPLGIGIEQIVPHAHLGDHQIVPRGRLAKLIFPLARRIDRQRPVRRAIAPFNVFKRPFLARRPMINRRAQSHRASPPLVSSG